MANSSVDLTSLANMYGSDKGNRVGDSHCYTYLYELLFQSIRQQAIHFLELGLALGGPEVGGSIDRIVPSTSVPMWLDYFPNASIYGFDVCDFSHLETQNPRFHFVRGDCGSVADLERLANSSERFDVIIDDASHASFHQQNAFKMLFHRLAPGGIYVIEDLQWQPSEWESRLPAPKTWDLFNDYFLRSEYNHGPVLERAFMDQLPGQLQSFSPFHDFSGASTAPKLLVFQKTANDLE